MTTETSARITALIKKLPSWVRRDLNASEASTRERAEESLAAMIVASIDKGEKKMGG